MSASRIPEYRHRREVLKQIRVGIAPENVAEDLVIDLRLVRSIVCGEIERLGKMGNASSDIAQELHVTIADVAAVLATCPRINDARVNAITMSETEISFAISCRALGQTWPEIGRRLGRNHSTVGNVVRDHMARTTRPIADGGEQVSGPPAGWTREKQAALVEMAIAGNATLVQMASALGVGRSTISRALAGWRSGRWAPEFPAPTVHRPRRGGLTPDEIKLAMQWRAGNVRWREIALRLNRQPDAVARAVQRQQHARALAGASRKREASEWEGPLAAAAHTLNGRVKPAGIQPGLWILDGRVVDNRGLVRAANKLLRIKGQTQIFYPGVLLCPPCTRKEQ